MSLSYLKKTWRAISLPLLAVIVLAGAGQRFLNGIDCNNQRATNVGTPTADSDAATKLFATNASNLASGTVANARLDSAVSLLGQTIALGSEVTGTLPVTSGGSGITTATAYGLIAGGTTSTGPFQSLGVGTAGQFLVSNGTALPSWSTGVLPTRTEYASSSGDFAWTKPSTGTLADVLVISGGAGGGAGRRGASASNRCGGEGGSGGSVVRILVPLSSLGATVAI